MSYPTAGHLQSFLANSHLTANGDWQGAIDAAIEEWENYTQWVPFLSDGASSVTRFDPPEGRYLDLGGPNGPGGFVSISLVETGVVGVATTGTARTLWQDFVLHYWKNRTTIIGIEFTGRQCGGDMRSIQVTGVKGFCSEVPKDVFQAVLRIAAASLWPTLSMAIGNMTDSSSPSGGAVEWREGDVTEKSSGDGVGAAQAALWTQQWMLTANRGYRRMRIA